LAMRSIRYLTFSASLIRAMSSSVLPTATQDFGVHPLCTRARMGSYFGYAANTADIPAITPTARLEDGGRADMPMAAMGDKYALG